MPPQAPAPYSSTPETAHLGLVQLYQLWPMLFRILDQPWKWFVALIGFILLVVGIGSLL